MPEPEYFHWLKGFEKTVWSSWNNDSALQSMGYGWEEKRQVHNTRTSKRRQYSKINGEAIRKRQKIQLNMSKHEQTQRHVLSRKTEQQHTHERKMLAPRLRNSRNDCYINSVMQSLHNLKATQDLVQNTTSHGDEMKFAESRKPLFDEFVSCIKKMETCSSTILDMRTLKHMFNHFMKLEHDNTFDNEEQHDAEEFFSKLCQCLHGFTNETQIDDNSIISDIFSTKTVKILTCLECGHRHRTPEEANWSLILKCEQLQNISTISLKTVMDQNFNTIELHQNERWQCHMCGRKTRSTTKEVISSTGNVLVVVLSRCFHDNNGPVKATAMIHCPTTLQLYTEQDSTTFFQVSQ